MLLSEKEKQTIDACRFCWMCRHVCPVGNATGQERNNARGRALALSMTLRGAPLSEDLMENVYECALCGACTKECVTGYDPVRFTKAVRLEGAMEGVTPAYIGRLIDRIAETGNPYGAGALDPALAAAADGLPASADTLLFLGTDARCREPERAAEAIALLKNAGVSFTVRKDEPDSGALMDALLGGARETREIMERAAAVLNGYAAVIAYDPADARVFLREYKEWDLGLRVKVKTFPAFLAELIENGTLTPARSDKTVTFQDPAQLARDLEETEPARAVLDACANRVEMLLWGKDTMWAGNLLMNEYMPRVMEGTARERWKNALATGADALVTACPSEYALLARTKPESMALFTLEQIVLGGLLL